MSYNATLCCTWLKFPMHCICIWLKFIARIHFYNMLHFTRIHCHNGLNLAKIPRAICNCNVLCLALQSWWQTPLTFPRNSMLLPNKVSSHFAQHLMYCTFVCTSPSHQFRTNCTVQITHSVPCLQANCELQIGDINPPRLFSSSQQRVNVLQIHAVIVIPLSGCDITIYIHHSGQWISLYIFIRVGKLLLLFLLLH